MDVDLRCAEIGPVAVHGVPLANSGGFADEYLSWGAIGAERRCRGVIVPQVIKIEIIRVLIKLVVLFRTIYFVGKRPNSLPGRDEKHRITVRVRSAITDSEDLEVHILSL